MAHGSSISIFTVVGSICIDVTESKALCIGESFTAYSYSYSDISSPRTPRKELGIAVGSTPSSIEGTCGLSLGYVYQLQTHR